MNPELKDKTARDLLDILFAGRNKEYGAYFLRRAYPRYLRNALLGMILLVMLGFSAPDLVKRISGGLAEEDGPKMTRVMELGPPPSIDPSTPLPPPPPKVETPPPPSRPTVKFVPPIVKKDEEVVDEQEIAKQEDLQKADPGTKTQEGDPNSTVITVIEPTEDLGGGAVEPAREPPKQQIFTVVEQMPSFPGGEKELLKFIYSNIDYPSVARENGVEGTVVISFVVDETGAISTIEVMREIGGGCGQEGARVVKVMPKWSPGRQNGRPVKVQYKLPIRFELQ